MKEIVHISPGAEGFARFMTPMGRRSPHYHEELEVNLVISGKAAYLFGTESIPLIAGSMIWLFPRQEHVLIDCSHDFSFWVLVFTPGLVKRHSLRSDLKILRSGDPGEILCRQLAPRAVDTLNAIYQSAAVGDEDHELSNIALAHSMLSSWQAFQYSRELPPRIDVHPAVAKAARLVSADPDDASLPGLAAKAGLSATRLSRLFARQMGISLTAFRQRTRLDRFLNLYRDGNRYTLIEAALLAGFGSYPQFHRVFRRFMKQSPAQYRASRKNPPSHDGGYGSNF